MRATGYVRAVDELGRIVLPIDLRRELEIASKDGVEIYVDGGNVILQKYRPTCVLCSGHEDLGEFKGKVVCGECRTAIDATFRVKV